MIDNWETDRLLAARIGPRHLAEICRLHSDRAVMRTLSADGRPIPDDQTEAGLVKAAAHWDRHGFGLWVFHDRRTGEFVGRGGLLRYTLADLANREVVGLAYAVVSGSWGRGYATEMAAGVLDVAFGRLGLARVASWTLPHNLASQRVMEKLAFRYETDFLFAGLEHRYYNVTPQWFAAARSQLGHDNESQETP